MQVRAAMLWWPLTPSAYLIKPATAAEEKKLPLLTRKHHSHLGNISLSIINATFQISPISRSCNSWTLFMRRSLSWYTPVSQTAGQESQSVLLGAGEPTGCLTGCKVTHGHYISLNKTRSAVRAEGSALLAFEERCAAKRQLTLLLYPDRQRLAFPPQSSTEGGADMLLSRDRGRTPTVHA